MQVGDLLYLKNIKGVNFPKTGILISIEGGRYRIGFPDGAIQIFHPTWIKRSATLYKEKK